MELPQDTSRGLECVLTPSQEKAVVEAARGALRDFVEVLRATGARPGEIAKAEGKHSDAALGAIVFQAAARGETSHKTARTGKPRIIFLPNNAKKIVEKLVKKYPSGPLFRSGRMKEKGENKGKRWGWTAENIAFAFYRLRRKTGINGLIAYSFRHTYAVRWLRAKGPIEALAEVLGTSIRMIQKSYGHLAAQTDFLRMLVDDQEGGG